MALLTERMAVGPLATNAYICYCSDTSRAVVVDPGFEANRILSRITAMNLTVSSVLLTRGHFDHVTDSEALAAALGVGIAMHPADKGQFQFAGALGELADGQAVPVGRGVLWVLHTPGHTPGSTCLHDPIGAFVMSGDTLFRNGVGRTDFPGGSQSQLVDSLRNRILVLPAATLVYPGHGPETTIGDEAGYLSC